MTTMRKQVFNKAAVTTAQTTVPIDLLSCKFGSLQLIWANGSGTPAGTLSMAASNDNGVTWTPVGIPGDPQISGNSGNLMLEIENIPYGHIQLTFTPSQGQVDLQIWLCAKW